LRAVGFSWSLDVLDEGLGIGIFDQKFSAVFFLEILVMKTLAGSGFTEFGSTTLLGINVH
jgi:hypothetical protein